MAIDLNRHRRALGAATNLHYALEARGVNMPSLAAKRAGEIREAWTLLSEVMPGVLEELPAVPAVPAVAAGSEAV